MSNAEKEMMDVAPVWVKIPDLPLEFWNLNSFGEFGNTLDIYLNLDMSFITTKRMTIDWILLSLNVQEGLSEEIKLIWGKEISFHKLDHEFIPF